MPKNKGRNKQKRLNRNAGSSGPADSAHYHYGRDPSFPDAEKKQNVLDNGNQSYLVSQSHQSQQKHANCTYQAWSNISVPMPMSVGQRVEEYIRWNNQCLPDGDMLLLHQVLDQEEFFGFDSCTLPQLKNLAGSVHLQNLCFKFQQSKGTVELRRSEVAGILANAFLCAGYGEVGNKINFSSLYSSYYARRQETKMEKIKCLLYYLDSVKYQYLWNENEKMNELVQYKKHIGPMKISQLPADLLKTRLRDLEIVPGESLAEAEMPQVDFANKRVGGGVLGNGALQEEIKFITCPELLLARLFPGDMNDNEAIIVSGAHQYVAYEGYAGSFKCLGNLKPYPKDFKNAPVICMDATDFSKRHPSDQYSKNSVGREILKAIAGFGGIGPEFETIATGNWGGGCFKGDPVLKMKIQWLAASICGKNLKYYTYTNTSLENELGCEVRSWKGNTVGDLYATLVRTRESADTQVPTRPMTNYSATSGKLKPHSTCTQIMAHSGQHSVTQYEKVRQSSYTSLNDGEMRELPLRLPGGCNDAAVGKFEGVDYKAPECNNEEKPSAMLVDDLPEEKSNSLPASTEEFIMDIPSEVEERRQSAIQPPIFEIASVPLGFDKEKGESWAPKLVPYSLVNKKRLSSSAIPDFGPPKKLVQVDDGQHCSRKNSEEYKGSHEGNNYVAIEAEDQSVGPPLLNRQKSKSSRMPDWLRKLLCCCKGKHNAHVCKNE